MNSIHKVFALPLPSRSFSHSSSHSLRATKTKEGVSTIVGVAFKARNFSDSVETRPDDNGERVYVKGVKPFVVERIDKDDDDDDNKSDEEKEKENSSGLNLKNVSEEEEEETEVEKEAWKLLQKALVTYCDSPVGTVAANDLSNESPLNYDQVFIRDFVPSALAFLLKGENEIVKNFLLHTLQLQVINNNVMDISRNLLLVLNYKYPCLKLRLRSQLHCNPSYCGKMQSMQPQLQL